MIFFSIDIFHREASRCFQVPTDDVPFVNEMNLIELKEKGFPRGPLAAFKFLRKERLIRVCCITSFTRIFGLEAITKSSGIWHIEELCGAIWYRPPLPTEKMSSHIKNLLTLLNPIPDLGAPLLRSEE